MYEFIQCTEFEIEEDDHEKKENAKPKENAVPKGNVEKTKNQDVEKQEPKSDGEIQKEEHRDCNDTKSHSCPQTFHSSRSHNRQSLSLVGSVFICQYLHI